MTFRYTNVGYMGELSEHNVDRMSAAYFNIVSMRVGSTMDKELLIEDAALFVLRCYRTCRIVLISPMFSPPPTNHKARMSPRAHLPSNPG